MLAQDPLGLLDLTGPRSQALGEPQHVLELRGEQARLLASLDGRTQERLGVGLVQLIGQPCLEAEVVGAILAPQLLCLCLAARQILFGTCSTV
ncbi:MAG: hypothetical protein U1A78_16640 [Polyangia bacterium]